jgi:hypothetical protein
LNEYDRTAEINRLLERLSEASSRRAMVVNQAGELAGNLGNVRAALGNPFHYAGENWERPENADESVANFSSYKSHEPALRLIREIRRADREMDAIREQLRHLGETIE